VPAGVRISSATLNGDPVTCVLLSGIEGPMAQTQSRLWVENEYCVSNTTGLLQVHSPVPGSYTVFGYSKKLQFHGKSMPDHFTTYVAGAQVITADLTIKDPAVTPEQLKPTPEMLAAGRSGVVLAEPTRMQISLPGSSNVMGSVVIRAELNNQGNVTDAEVSAASDRSLVDSAVAAAKQFQLHGPNEVYLTVRFSPQAE
jgi:TonB family protein